MMRYCPDASLTAVRTFSIRAGLDASTVTPGSTAPDESLTTPVTLAPPEPCARAAAGSQVSSAAIPNADATARLIVIPSNLPFEDTRGVCSIQERSRREGKVKPDSWRVV